MPNSFNELGNIIGQVYRELRDAGVIVPRQEVPPPTVPMDFNWARELGLIRKPASFMTSISDERGQELLYAGMPISAVLEQGKYKSYGMLLLTLPLIWLKFAFHPFAPIGMTVNLFKLFFFFLRDFIFKKTLQTIIGKNELLSRLLVLLPYYCYQLEALNFSCRGFPGLGIGGTLSLLWFQRRLPPYATQFLEMCLMVTADHGPAVSGAHNTIVCTRAGKDLVSSLVSGLLTIVSNFLLHWPTQIITSQRVVLSTKLFYNPFIIFSEAV